MDVKRGRAETRREEAVGGTAAEIGLGDLVFHSGQPIVLGIVGLYALYTGVRDSLSGVARGRWTSWSRATQPNTYFAAVAGKFLVSAVFIVASVVELVNRAN